MALSLMHDIFSIVALLNQRRSGAEYPIMVFDWRILQAKHFFDERDYIGDAQLDAHETFIARTQSR
jgi:hypothetical protein